MPPKAPATSATAPPTTLFWGRFIPDANASPHMRLSCTLHDFVTSPNLVNCQHQDGPFFASPNLFLILAVKLDITNSAEKAAFTSSGLDHIAGARFLDLQINTVRPDIDIPPHQFPKYYGIWARASLFDEDGKRLIGATGGNVTCPIATSIFFSWPRYSLLQAPGYVDPSPSINWECIVGILKHLSETQVQRNGVAIPPAQLDHHVLNSVDPLKHLGYLGWPGFVPPDPPFPAPGQAFDFRPSFKVDDGSES